MKTLRNKDHLTVYRSTVSAVVKPGLRFPPRPVPALHDPQPLLQAAAVLLQGLAEGHLRVLFVVRHAVLTQRTLAGQTVQVSHLEMNRKKERGERGTLLKLD